MWVIVGGLAAVVAWLLFCAAVIGFGGMGKDSWEARRK